MSPIILRHLVPFLFHDASFNFCCRLRILLFSSLAISLSYAISRYLLKHFFDTPDRTTR